MNSLRRLWFLVVGPATRIFNVFTFFLLVWLMTWFDPLCNVMFLFFSFFKLNFSLATLSASYTYKSINTNDIYIAQVNMLPMDSRGMTFVSCRWSDGFFSVKTGSCEIVTSSAVGRNRVVAADEDKPIESKEREIQRNNSIEEQDKADRSFSAADFRKWKRHGAKFETNFDRNRQMHRQLLFVTQSIRVFFFFKFNCWFVASIQSIRFSFLPQTKWRFFREENGRFAGLEVNSECVRVCACVSIFVEKKTIFFTPREPVHFFSKQNF